jgi:hypothetical protein
MSFTPSGNLYENAKRHQWNAATDIPWDTEIGWEPEVDRETALALRAFRIGQQYTGEAMAVTSDQVGPLPPDREARAFMATQFMDEVRHAEAFDRYLVKLGAPPCELGRSMELIRSFFATLDNYTESLVCIQVLFEGLGVDLFDSESEQSPCPLLQAIYERVRRDEARHTAFGTLYLDHLVPELSPADRRRLQQRLDDGVGVFFAQSQAAAEAMPPAPLEYLGRMAKAWQDAIPPALANVGERLRRWNLRLNLSQSV